MGTKKSLTPAEENAKVLAQLELKESALKKKLGPWGLTEEDFVQFLNLETKKDLVAHASDKTLQQIADDKKETNKEIDKSLSEHPRHGLMDYLVLGPSGVVYLDLLVLGVTAAGAIGIGVPYLCGRYVYGKTGEMVRTFKASYKNDPNSGKFFRAMRRAFEYPFFRVPLINKMRRDMFFDGGPVKREGFRYQLKERRKNHVKNAAKLFKKSFMWAGGICGTIGAWIGFCDYGMTAAALPLVGKGLLWGAGISTALCVGVGIAKVISSIESKAIRGRRLVEQEFEYPPVKENVEQKEETVEVGQQRGKSQDDLGQSLKEQTGGEVYDSEFDKNRSRMDITVHKKDYQKKETEKKQKRTSRKRADTQESRE